jgi:thiosulfate/3-mercaptopyruvate sulfurtransferase
MNAAARLAIAGLCIVTPATAQSPGPLVSADWLADRLGDPSVVILHTDSRRDSYDAGHIPGARFIGTGEITVAGERDVGYELPPVDDLVAVLQRAGVSDAGHIVVYAGSNPISATRLWLTLDYLGLGDRASVLDGGLPRWNAQSLTVTTEVPAVSPATLTAAPRTGMLVGAEWILARLEDEETALIDARPDDEYTGDDGGMGGMANPGHIPGARQLYWEELVVNRQTNPVFLPEPELRRRFVEAGADGAGAVVAYCMVGARASVVYFVGRMLGYEMRFYDGSWHDWGTRDLPYVSGRNPR